MKIRKVNLAIASAIMMAGSAAAIAPASAAKSPAEYGREVAGDFVSHWNDNFKWCVDSFGEELRDLCGVHTTMSMNYHVYLGKGAGYEKQAAYFDKLADAAWDKLMLAKYGEETGSPFE